MSKTSASSTAGSKSPAQQHHHPAETSSGEYATAAAFLTATFKEHEEWALRRQKRIPPQKKLFVLTSMDERVPIEEILSIEEGDAFVFRNAGGVVTDDAIRSALLATQLYGVTEIVVVMNTESELLCLRTDAAVKELKGKGVDVDTTNPDPTFPELSIGKGGFGKWLRFFDNVDDACARQVEALKNSPVLPKGLTISGFVYEVESGNVRLPHALISKHVNTSQETGAK